MPVIQKRATSLPPVLTILAVVGFGVLFGLIGVLVATPLLLALIVLVRMIYVEDMLGDRKADDALESWRRRAQHPRLSTGSHSTSAPSFFTACTPTIPARPRSGTMIRA